MTDDVSAELPLPDISASAEDYLKTISAIELTGSAAGTSDLAQRLGHTPASANGMIRRLTERKLITHELYHGVRLTAAGRRMALRTLRRHRVLECYLTQVLGFPWDRVHEEAEQLEHAASDQLIDHMAAALGEPAFDPHGAPIPTRDGIVDETVHPTLADIESGSRVRVARVLEQDAGMLRYLAELGIRPGEVIVLTERAPFEGPITLSVAGVVRVIGPTLAAQVHVQPITRND